MAQRLALVEKAKPYPLAVAGPADFRCGQAAPVDPQVVLDEPGHSLYCLDHDNRRALFTRTGVDPGGAPFYFQAQYAHATEVVTLSYDELFALSTPGEPGGVFLYSTGRCGSTLVATALAERGGLTGISEPDVLTQLVMLAPRLTGPQLRDLTRACVRVLARGHPVVIKPRSFAVELAGLLHEEFPQFASVFLYREPLSWARSTARAFAGYDPALNTDPAAVQDRLGRLIPLVGRWRRRMGRLLSPEEVMACQWVAQLERALALRHRGADLFTATYEDLLAGPGAVLGALFAHCGLPAPSGLDAILARDSQEGTSLSRSATTARAAGPGLDEAAFTRTVAALWVEALR
ncbi:hypothetical protein Cme02nite_31430 [Catellatospora methionotrophica]|uniref:Sulfotransferase family protein n=1 Tax=Catellatospora methionotrophica TaxID=121620 RepID=A0A8J3LGM5_9ACTN|nr:hypothetical protein [Catellatospora methionotrophica]GIG14811.1 hypothetical protein Cme02nite_31430 [Catellatospora methionotrophica]